MRRKAFNMLFETSSGMDKLMRERSMWRSFFYFTMSVGLFTGVVTNCWLINMSLQIRMAIIAAVILFFGTALTLYSFTLHGIMETLGSSAGDPVGLICLMGYTTLPFLVMTPCALLAGKLGLVGIPLLLVSFILCFIWMMYLLVNVLEEVYLVNWFRALVAVLFSLLMLYVVFIFPFQVLLKLALISLEL